MPEQRPFQIEGTNFLVRRLRAVMGDEMGLGKTNQVLKALEFLNIIVGKPHPLNRGGTILLVGKSKTPLVWLREIAKWVPGIDLYIIQGNKTKRSEIWAQAKSGEYPGFYCCTYAVMRNDIMLKTVPLRWDAVIFEESGGRSGINNRKTAAFKTAKFHARRTDVLFFITGAPIKRNPASVWTFLNLINPSFFTSYWRFVNTFCEVVDGMWGGKEILGPRNMPQFQKTIAPHIIRRLKKEVAPEMPPKTRQILPATMTEEQERIYEELIGDMIAELPNNDVLVAAGRLPLLMRLRQLLVMPKILHPELGYGGGLEAIIDNHEETGERPNCVIFTPFIKAMPWIEERLLNEGWPSVVRIQGGMSIEELGNAIKTFKTKQGAALCSIQYADSFDLDSASYGYFLGAEWEPADNDQAEDRMHRLTTKLPVNLYYVEHGRTIEGDVYDTLLIKRQNVYASYGTPQRLREFLRR